MKAAITFADKEPGKPFAEPASLVEVEEPVHCFIHVGLTADKLFRIIKIAPQTTVGIDRVLPELLTQTLEISVKARAGLHD